MIEFTEWLPDRVPLASAVSVAKNVVPSQEGFRPFRGPEAKTAALAAACLGAGWFADSANTFQTFAGTGAKLYKRAGDAWTDVSKGGGYTGSHWEMVKWGGLCIATNGVEAAQKLEMSAGTNFADLTGAPIAFRVATVRDFVVFGDTVESSTAYHSRIRWSGFNNAETYGSSLATQADFQDLLGNGGRVQKIVSGDVGVIFQERSIWLMVYVGPSVIFRFDEVEPGRGTPSPDSVCSMGSQVFYYSHDGFMAFDRQNGSQPIGAGKVDRWFHSTVDPTKLGAVRGVVDRDNRYAYWSFASGSAGATNDMILVFHITSGQWSYAVADTEILFESVAVGYTLDSLDSVFADIDTDSIPVDSRAYLGGAVMVGAFDSAHKLATFDGDYLTATIESGEQGGEGRTFITALRPLIDGAASVTAQIGSRNTVTENVNWGPVLNTNSAGQMTTRRNSRYHTIRTLIAGGFTRALGIDVTSTPEGGR